MNRFFFSIYLFNSSVPLLMVLRICIYKLNQIFSPLEQYIISLYLSNEKPFMYIMHRIRLINNNKKKKYITIVINVNNVTIIIIIITYLHTFLQIQLDMVYNLFTKYFFEYLYNSYYYFNEKCTFF